MDNRYKELHDKFAEVEMAAADAEDKVKKTRASTKRHTVIVA